MLSGNSRLRLVDLGERKIVSSIIGEFFGEAADPKGVVVGFGDDAAVVEPPGSDRQLVLTTDPCPTPAICMVDPAARNLYHYGWMTVVINMSDLAAMGATPIALVVSTVMPERLAIDDYRQFLNGLKDAADTWNCNILGGNIKDGPGFTATGAALGHVRAGGAMRRVGAKQGDVVLVCGPSGYFWSGILHRRIVQRGHSVEIDAEEEHAIKTALHRPTPRLREGSVLANSGYITACMDNSDGIVDCLYEIAAVNGIEIVVDTANLVPPKSLATVAKYEGLDPRVIMLSWGDWQLVCTASAENLTAIEQLLANLDPPCPCTVIGHVRAAHETGNVVLRSGDSEKDLPDFSSKRFHSTSIFTHGINAYLTILREVSQQLADLH